MLKSRETSLTHHFKNHGIISIETRAAQGTPTAQLRSGWIVAPPPLKARLKAPPLVNVCPFELPCLLH